MSIETAKQRVDKFKLSKVKFLQEDATNMSFPNETFDVVFAGNVTSLIDDKQKVLKEYWRVLKPNGYLVAVPMYYIKPPSEQLVNDVRKAIQVNINVYYKRDWEQFFIKEQDELFDSFDYKFIKCKDEQIQNFCYEILKREHLKQLNKEAKEALEKCYIQYMHLFNENLSHMGFTIFIIRRKEEDIFNDPELYHSERR